MAKNELSNYAKDIFSISGISKKLGKPVKQLTRLSNEEISIINIAASSVKDIIEAAKNKNS